MLPYHEGYQAFDDGEAIGSNPYEGGTPAHKAWNEGHANAAKDAKYSEQKRDQQRRSNRRHKHEARAWQ